MRCFRAPLVSTVLLALSSTVAFAAEDLILRERITISGGVEGPREQVQYYAPRLRIVDDDRYRSIVDLDAKSLTKINKKAKTYSVITFAELGQRLSQDQRVKELPPQVRGMIHADDKVILSPTGKTETIAGYPARQFGIEGTGISGNIWVTEKLELSGNAAEWSKVAELFGGKSTPGGHLDDALAKIKGVPLRRTISMEPLPLVTTEVIEAKYGLTPQDMKRIPEGFTKVEPVAGRQGKAGKTPPPTPAP